MERTHQVSRHHTRLIISAQMPMFLLRRVRSRLALSCTCPDGRHVRNRWKLTYERPPASLRIARNQSNIILQRGREDFQRSSVGMPMRHDLHPQ